MTQEGTWVHSTRLCAASLASMRADGRERPRKQSWGRAPGRSVQAKHRHVSGGCRCHQRRKMPTPAETLGQLLMASSTGPCPRGNSTFRRKLTCKHGCSTRCSGKGAQNSATDPVTNNAEVSPHGQPHPRGVGRGPLTCPHTPGWNSRPHIGGGLCWSWSSCVQHAPGPRQEPAFLQSGARTAQRGRGCRVSTGSRSPSALAAVPGSAFPEPNTECPPQAGGEDTARLHCRLTHRPPRHSGPGVRVTKAVAPPPQDLGLGGLPQGLAQPDQTKPQPN